MADAHPGFAAIQNKIAAREGVSKASAGAMLASSTRKSSPSAKSANPNLNNVKMGALARRAKKAAKKPKEGSAAEERGESPAFEKTEDEPRQ
jgi:hypothetical protein